VSCKALVGTRCGLDVHQATVVACLLIVRKTGKVQKQMRTFGTTTQELLSLREWLLSEGCTHNGHGEHGVYWKPSTHPGRSAKIVVPNAQHVRRFRGRKTDVKDANGSRICSATGCSALASFPKPSANSAT